MELSTARPTGSQLGALALDSVLLLLLQALDNSLNSDDSMTVMCPMPVKHPDYSRFMLYAFMDRLCRKLCRHNRRISSANMHVHL